MSPHDTPCHHDENKVVATLADVLSRDRAGLTATRRRDMVSAVKRICEMAGTTPAGVAPEPGLPEGTLNNSSRRPFRQRQELFKSAKPSGCRAAACRSYRTLGPGRRQTPPSLGTPARGHR